jgi:hypothetical protein
VAKKKDSPPVEKWSPENHERWKQAGHEHLTKLFSVLKRAKITWSDMGPEGSENWKALDKAIASRLKDLRANQGCPEALMYLSYAMDVFMRARKGQPNLDGSGGVSDEVRIVHDRMMDTLLVAGQWKCARDKYVPYAGARPSFLVELEQRAGIEEGASFQKKAVLYYRILQQRSLATR